MPVNKDESGRRWVQAEVEVPGTPAEVWKAIASGPGISSWFVPTKVEEREGGAINASFGPGMDSVSTVKTWDPPRRLVAESRDDMGPDDPAVATEWTVEARSGGTCVVRVVHSWTTASDKWDDQFEGHTHGWVGFFRILRLYLAHFSGQSCSAIQLMAMAPEPKGEVWAKLTTALGLSGAATGERIKTAAGAPPLAGLVERVGESELLVRLDEPAPGIAHLFAMPMGGSVFLSIRFFLYGERASAATSQAEPLWQAWLAQHFPAGG